MIGYSRGLECFKKTVYTDPSGIEQIVESDGPMKCGADEKFCITASGSFNDGVDPCQFSKLKYFIKITVIYPHISLIRTGVI